VSRGSQLNFDSFGRVAVIHDGVYAVLNDATWINLMESDETTRLPMTDVVCARDGRTYYGGRASWGLVEIERTGKLHARPLMPENPPAWTRTMTFDKLIVTDDGVYFVSHRGIAFWDFERKESQIFDLGAVTTAFAVGNRVFISSFDQALRYIDIDSRSVRSMPGTILDQRAVVCATTLDENHALIALADGPVLAFNGEEIIPWSQDISAGLEGRISVLEHLADGNVALAIIGKGVFILSPEGKMLWSLAVPQYQQVSKIASREPGVMWLLTEDSIEKVLYQGGLTSFGQRLGLAVSWPGIATCNNKFFVSSEIVLYETPVAESAAVAHFTASKIQPPGGAWSLTSWDRHLLVGNRSEVHSLAVDGTWKFVTGIKDLRQLVMVSENVCYAIGQSEIALLEWNGGRWTEPVPRVSGLRNPAIAHRAGQSVWVEMAGDGVARISRKDGALEVMILPNEPWTKALWVNIGVVNDTVVLSPAQEKRRFFDEKTGAWVQKPELQKLLDRSPRWLNRVWSDETGIIWATHRKGVVRFTPKDGDYEMDQSSFDFMNDLYPAIRFLPGNDPWVTASRSLYHIEAAVKKNTKTAGTPVLVSFTDTSSNTELLAKREGAPFVLPFSRNSLAFRFFSGGYDWRSTPTYEFKLNANDSWAPLDLGSVLRFPGLHEGKYELQVRFAGEMETSGMPLRFSFEISSPWHRTWPAYALYTVLGFIALVALTRWPSHLARRRNRTLERIVHERTGELESAMKKLNEETRITATLAERDRLAGEIHDSVQQGLSGAILQLDTTLKLPKVESSLRARLNVVRNMVSYARQEVQNAVWDLDSSLLNGNDLGDALRKVALFTASSTLIPTVSVSGNPIKLPRFTTHHLLRIAQEGTANAVRHAQARRISIELEYQTDVVSLRISDDGVGFHPVDVLNKPGHFGLRGIRGRAAKLRGELTINSTPADGTVLHVQVPLKNEKSIPSSSRAEVHHV